MCIVVGKTSQIAQVYTKNYLYAWVKQFDLLTLEVPLLET